MASLLNARGSTLTFRRAASIYACLSILLLGAQQPHAQAPARTAPPPPASATIRGHVIAGDTGQGLRKAQVRLIQVDVQPDGSNPAGRENRLATTDADGTFEFKDLPAGRYILTASKGSYISVSRGRQQQNAGGKPLDIRAGQTVERVDITLPRGGVITGRIFDEFGEALSGIQVVAMEYQFINGQRQLVPTGGRMATTNDLGEFRLFGVPLGQYYLRATWQRMGPGDPTSPDRTGYPTTFFPGTQNAADAQRITIGAGQTVSDLVMAMSPIKTARVEGTLVDSRGRPMGGAILMIMQQTTGFDGVMNGQSVRPDGTFTFASLPPGDYTLRTQPLRDQKETAVMKLTIGSEDVKDLRLVGVPPSTITGRLVVDPAQAASLPSPMTFSIFATPMGGAMMGGIQPAPARVNDDMTFELSAGVGNNHINTFNMPPGWSIRAIRVNGVDVIDDGIDVKPGEQVTGVDVELTNKIATVSGFVTNTRGERAKDCTLVIFAADNKRWKPNGRYLRTARPDQEGRFKVSGLPPSEYNIIAIDKLETGQWTDPDFLERLRFKATAFTLSEGETKTVDLKLNTVG